MKLLSFPHLCTRCQARFAQNFTAAKTAWMQNQSIRPIDRILIANRGEIACRVIRTARLLGVKTVAVFSDSDRSALHVAQADEAFHIGPSPANESYLRGEKLLEICQRARVDAIHPGYGFLSENVEFAKSCAEHDVIFIGPPPSAIHDMGIKSKAKQIMEAAGVPIIKGYHEAEQSEERLEHEANAIGYPLMLKAVRGGGGKGMRIVMEPKEFKAQLASAKREAMQAFGNDDMIIERFISRPRHIEVQIFGDSHGNYVHLWERDCSVQRRHQKVLEEAPGPHLTEDTREQLGQAAVRAAQAVGYTGAGTVEFIMDGAETGHPQFYFMEMNTRLQVEHPVTEMITGVDLVEWQIKVAEGYPLPMSQTDIPRNGHAVEARIYAEDPQNAFMPGAGPLLHLEPPKSSPWLRVETGVSQGDEVSVYYDPMIAKVIAWGPGRDSAIKRLRSALQEYHVAGLKTNIGFLDAVLAHDKFKDGLVSTDFIPENEAQLFEQLTRSDKAKSLENCAALAAAYIFYESSETANVPNFEPNDPFSICDGYRINLDHERTLNFVLGDGNEDQLSIGVKFAKDGVLEIRAPSGSPTTVIPQLEALGSDCIEFTCSMDTGHVIKAKMVKTGEEIHLFSINGHFTYKIPQRTWEKEVKESVGGSGGLVSPMPGVINSVNVQVGDKVKQGDPLVVMVAMKMEYVIKAPHDAIVEKVLVESGENVAKGVQLILLNKEE